MLDRIRNTDTGIGNVWLVAIGLAVVVLLAITWFFRPWFHGIIYTTLFVTPDVVQWVTIGGLITLAGWYWDSPRVEMAGPVIVLVMLVGLPLVTGVLGMGVGPASIYAQEDIADRMDARLEPTENLTAVDSDHPRIQTRKSADTMTNNAFTESRYKVGPSRTVVHDETLYWGYQIEPNGLGNYMSESTNGVYLTSMESHTRTSAQVRGDMAYGPGMRSWHDHKWRLQKDRYWVDYRGATVVPHEGKPHLYASEVCYDVRIGNPLNGRLPVLYSVPEFCGVAVLEPDGEVTHLTPEEAANHEITHDQPYYPYDLARTEVRSLNYRHGVFNKWVLGSKTDMIELAEVPGDNNKQPFTVPTEDGLKYVTAVEPWGAGTGVNTIIEMDAQYVPGEPIAVHSVEGEALTGPAKAPNYVRNADEKRNWQNYDVAEPIPVHVDGKLYWMTHIVQSNGAGIDGIYFVDASDNSVVKFEEVSTTNDVDTIKAFLAGESVDRSEPDRDGGSSPVEEGDVLVTIYDENGEQVDQFVINGTTTIEISSS